MSETATNTRTPAGSPSGQGRHGDEITAKLGAAQAVFVTEYRGMSVGQLAGICAAAAPVGAEHKVYKNTLARFAAARPASTASSRSARRPDRHHVRQRRRRRRRQGAARRRQDQPAARPQGWGAGRQVAVRRGRRGARRSAVPRGAAGAVRRCLAGAAGQDRRPAAGPAAQLRLRPQGPHRSEAKRPEPTLRPLDDHPIRTTHIRYKENTTMATRRKTSSTPSPT